MPDNRRTRIIFLLILGAVTIWLCYLIARPFVTPVFSAMIIAIVFYPVHVWLHRFVRRRNVAALLSTLLVLLTIIIPSVLLGIAIKRELTAAYQALSARTGEDGGWLPYLSQLADQVKAWLSRYIDLSGVDLRAELLNRLQQWTAALLGKTANVIGDFTSFLLNLK